MALCATPAYMPASRTQPNVSIERTFISLAREAAGLTTTYQSCTMVQGVFQTFADVASALRRNVPQPEFDRMLAALPPGAAQFWSI